jgi:ribosomal protein S12 methylthiotransferase
MEKIKVGLISLGCEKNLVDSEMILGVCKEAGFEIKTDLNEVDIIIINTCGFITSAKEEAINTIFEALDYQENGTKIVVTGCLVQRYLDDLKKEIPEVDLYIPIKDYPKMGYSYVYLCPYL